MYSTVYTCSSIAMWLSKVMSPVTLICRFQPDVFIHRYRCTEGSWHWCQYLHLLVNTIRLLLCHLLTFQLHLSLIFWFDRCYTFDGYIIDLSLTLKSPLAVRQVIADCYLTVEGGGGLRHIHVTTSNQPPKSGSRRGVELTVDFSHACKAWLRKRTTCWHWSLKALTNDIKYWEGISLLWSII